MHLEGNPIHVLAVGGAVPELGGSVERADDLLGALARLADGGVDVVLLCLELPTGGAPMSSGPCSSARPRSP